MSDTDTNTDPHTVPEQAETQGTSPLESTDPVELPEPESGKPKPDLAAQPGVSSAVHEGPEGSVEPAAPQPAKPHEERFALPASFEDRFILTREAGRQDMFRAYDDMRPAISDRGDSLHTRERRSQHCHGHDRTGRPSGLVFHEGTRPGRVPP